MQVDHNLLRIGPLPVDLIQSNDERDLIPFGEIKDLKGLGLDPLDGWDYQEDKVGDLGTSKSQVLEGLMPRGVYKGDFLLRPVCDKGEGSDLLG